MAGDYGKRRADSSGEAEGLGAQFFSVTSNTEHLSQGGDELVRPSSVRVSDDMSMREYNNCRGVSLIEILIALAVLSILSIILGTFLIGQSQINATNQNIAAHREAAMYMLNVMSRDLRMIGYNNGAGEDVSSASSTSITYNTDWDDSGTAESYSYSLSGNRLKKNDTIIFDHVDVQSLNFSYYDGSGTEITDLSTTSNRASIRQIKVRLQVQLPSSQVKKGFNPVLILEEQVKPRNMGL